MISNDIKKSMKSDAKRKCGRAGTWVALVLSGGLTVSLMNNGEKPIDGQSLLFYWGMWFAILWPCFYFWMRSNPAKKEYLKNMQKHIMGELANADDPILIQKLGVAMSYYGNKMSEVQMAEVKARAGSHYTSHHNHYR